jgi:hypothetical protein
LFFVITNFAPVLKRASSVVCGGSVGFFGTFYLNKAKSCIVLALLFSFVSIVILILLLGESMKASSRLFAQEMNSL